ncbi:hypothetical protein EV363DRAFT_1412838 [Boletus edulis]|nr:hypothetical protein EV363DRAFT_1412838 [Boletus edulis]
MLAPSLFFRDLRIRQFLSVAGQAVLTYDYLLTFELEVDCIWCTPWSMVKAIFLLNRYGTLIVQSFITLEELGILSHGSQKFCMRFLWLQSLFVLFLSETTRTLLLLRARALLGCSYRVAMCLVSVYILYVLVRGGYSSYLLFKHDRDFTFPYLEETGVCVIPSTLANVWLSGVTSLLLDTGLFAMIAYYLYKLCKGSQQLRHSPLLRLLVRDGEHVGSFDLLNPCSRSSMPNSAQANIFYDVLGILSLSAFADEPLYFLQVSFSFPFLVIAGQRVVLNLRGLQSEPYTTQDISRAVDMQIAALRHRSFWQSVDFWMNDIHQELELTEEPIRFRRTQTTVFRTEAVSSHELAVIHTTVGSSPYACAV